MKIFAIKDNEVGSEIDLGYFFYYEKLNEYYIELNDELDEWDYPFILDSFAKRKMWIVDQYHTKLFIAQRIIPSDRQNIGMVLKDNGLEEYDEIKLFLLADGRCAQDNCYIKSITYDRLPERIRKRLAYRLVSAAYAGAGKCLVGFSNGEVGLLELRNPGLLHDHRARRLLAYTERLTGVSITRAGFELRLDDDFGIPYYDVYQYCDILSVNMTTISDLVLSSLMTTQDLIDDLGCSRQNINDYVKRGRMKPLDLNAKVQVFTSREYQKLLQGSHADKVE